MTTTTTTTHEEPECWGLEEHDWQSPHEIVGGCDSTPGVRSTGGTSMRSREVCRHCGCYREVVMRYEGADEQSRLWSRAWSNPDADTDHETADDMWGSLGWDVAWIAEDPETGAGAVVDEGQVVHPVCTVADLDTYAEDADVLRAITVGTHLCDAERQAYREAIAYAREALDSMRAVAAALAEAVVAYEGGDRDACVEALDTASRIESSYGDDPAASALRTQVMA